MEYCLKAALGEPEHIIAYNTYQVKNYDRYELAGFSEEENKSIVTNIGSKIFSPHSTLADEWLNT